jgi:flagellar basal body-associated protein FliL
MEHWRKQIVLVALIVFVVSFTASIGFLCLFHADTRMGRTQAPVVSYMTLGGPFVLSVDSGFRKRYVHFDMVIQVKDKRMADMIWSKKSKIRDAVLVFFSSKNESYFLSENVLSRIKEDAASVIRSVLKNQSVEIKSEDILVESFVLA